MKEPGGVISEMPNSLQNRLLRLLTKAELKRFSPNLEAVLLSRGQILSETGSRLKHAYFPTTAVVSLMYVMENGVAAEVAMVGSEGVSAFPCSWAAGSRHIALSCRTAATHIGCGGSISNASSTAAARCTATSCTTL